MKYNLLKLSAVSAAIMNPACAAFHKDALVSTSDGRLPMSQLEVGHHVRSFSPRTEAMGSAMVLGKSLADQANSIVKIDLGEKGVIKAMLGQQLFDVGGQRWVKAKDLTADHILLGEDGSLINIYNVQKQRRTSFSLPHEVTVDHKDHTFFVDGVLNHNMFLVRAAWRAITVGSAVAGTFFTVEEVGNRTADATRPSREASAQRFAAIQQENLDARNLRQEGLEARDRWMAEREIHQIEGQASDANSAAIRNDYVLEGKIPTDLPETTVQIAPVAAEPVVNNAADRLHDSLRREVAPNPNRDSGPIPTRLPNDNPHRRGGGHAEIVKSYQAPSAEHLRAHDLVSAEYEKSGIKPSQEEFQERIIAVRDSIKEGNQNQDIIVRGFQPDGKSGNNSIDNQVTASNSIDAKARGAANLLSAFLRSANKDKADGIKSAAVPASVQAEPIAIVDLPTPVAISVVSEIHAKIEKERLAQEVCMNNEKLAEMQRQVEEERKSQQMKEFECRQKSEFSNKKNAEEERFKEEAAAIKKAAPEKKEPESPPAGAGATIVAPAPAAACAAPVVVAPTPDQSLVAAQAHAQAQAEQYAAQMAQAEMEIKSERNIKYYHQQNSESNQKSEGAAKSSNALVERQRSEMRRATGRYW